MAAGPAEIRPSECPSDDRIALFVEEGLGAAEAESIREHIGACVSCRRRLAQVGAGGAGRAPSARLQEASPPTRNAGREDVLSAGSLIASKYRVLREIGSGGMGKVFAAVHMELGQTVAIKVLHPELGREDNAVRRFLREGRSAALLKSDHAVRINDVGRLPSGLPYLVMEYLEGEDLDRLRTRLVLSIEDVADYILQALGAVAEAHDAGIVHRDIKPQNLFLARLPDGELRVKVLDFGLAKELPSMNGGVSGNSALTTDNMILGSPYFMSPEQIRNPTMVDVRTDVWALGATMFLLLTGVPPYTSNTVHGLLARILADPPPSARALRPEVPSALDAVLIRCLTKDVFVRFQNVADLGAALRAAVTKSNGENAGADAVYSGAESTIILAPSTPKMPVPLWETAGLGATRVAAAPEKRPPVRTPSGAEGEALTVLAAGVQRVTEAMPAAPAPAATSPARSPGPHRVETLVSALAAPVPARATASSGTWAAARPRAAASSRRRVWTAVLCVVATAALVVVVFVVRARARQRSGAARPTLAQVTSVSASPTANSSPRESPSSLPLQPVLAAVEPSAVAQASASAVTVPAASVPAPSANGPRRPKVPTANAPASASQPDPYDWGK